MPKLINIERKQFINIIKITKSIVGLGILFSISSCSPKLESYIIGSWKQVGTTNSCIVFQKDGYFRMSGDLAFSTLGTYTVTGNDEMSMTFKDLKDLGLSVQPIPLKAEFKKNMLILKGQSDSESITLTLERSQC